MDATNFATEAAFCAAGPVPQTHGARTRAAARPRCSRPVPRMSSAQPTRRAMLRWAIAAAASSAALVAPGAAPVHAYGAYEEPPKKPAAAKPKKPQFTREGGIAYSDLSVGSGPSPQEGDFVIVDYIAYLSNGVAFDNTKQPGRKSLVFQVGKNKVIPGLETAIMGMQMGGHRLAIIPPEKAFGERGVCFPEQGCLVPPDETLEYGMLSQLLPSPPSSFLCNTCISF